MSDAAYTFQAVPGAPVPEQLAVTISGGEVATVTFRDGISEPISDVRVINALNADPHFGIATAATAATKGKVA